MHEMRLNDKPFISIKNGTKVIEIRLNDEKRRKIKINDIIEFSNLTTNEKLKVKVIDLYRYDNFDILFNSFDKKKLGYKDNEIANPSDMLKYYSKDEENKWGVLAIEIKII